jgi:hypothetical protein
MNGMYAVHYIVPTDDTGCLPGAVEMWVTLLYAPLLAAATRFQPMARHKNAHGIKELAMNPLDSIKGTLIAGLVLAIVLVFVVRALGGA